MKVTCKKNDSDKFYSKLEPGKEYELVDLLHIKETGHYNYHVIYLGCNNTLCKGNCKGNCNKGMFLKEYFYNIEELRDIKLNKLLY